MKPAVIAISALYVLLVLSASGCGKDTSADNSGGAAGDPSVSAAPKTAPQTEEGLVEWVAKAIETKSLEMLAQAIGPEQMADFRRERERDPEGFWKRGQRWVANVKSGFSLAHRSDGSVKRWKALIKFGNGQSETVVFARVAGRLMFEKL